MLQRSWRRYVGDDAWQGMEGQGPEVEPRFNQRAAIAGLDWLAVDRVASKIMNIKQGILANGGDHRLHQRHQPETISELAEVPRALNYCGQAGLANTI